MTALYRIYWASIAEAGVRDKISIISTTNKRFKNQTVIWNLILRDGTNTDVSEAVFKKMLEKVNHCWCFSLSTQRRVVVTVAALWLMVAPGVVTITASAAAWGRRVVTVTIAPFHYIPMVYSLLHSKYPNKRYSTWYFSHIVAGAFLENEELLSVSLKH